VTRRKDYPERCIGEGCKNGLCQVCIRRSIVAAFRQGLKEAGYIEGQNVTIEYRWAEGQDDRLPGMATDLLHHRCAVIIGGGYSAAQAAKAATTTVPIVFVTGGDPVMHGLVASLNRPGGNTTGVSVLSSASGTKRLELLRQLVPKAAAIAMLVDPNLPQAESERRDVQGAVRDAPDARPGNSRVRSMRAYWTQHAAYLSNAGLAGPALTRSLSAPALESRPSMPGFPARRRSSRRS
jgi:ABC transporter substrate binding protein